MTLTSSPPHRQSEPRAQYGGRPTFGARRSHPDGDAQLVLYELLPREQAEARRRRWERAGRSVRLFDLDDAFETDVFDGETWSWDDWHALKVARLDGPRCRAVASVVREAMKSVDLDPDVLTSTREGEMLLPEEAGIRMALAFLGVKPLRRYDRMRALARGVGRMSDEECYYWHALCRSPSTPNGAKALRTLLTDHVE